MEWKYFPGTSIWKCTGNDSLETHSMLWFLGCLGCLLLFVYCVLFPRRRSAKIAPPATLFRYRCPLVSQVGPKTRTWDAFRLLVPSDVTGRPQNTDLGRFSAICDLWCRGSGKKWGPATERPGDLRRSVVVSAAKKGRIIGVRKKGNV